MHSQFIELFLHRLIYYKNFNIHIFLFKLIYNDLQLKISVYNMSDDLMIFANKVQ